jgi:hypothetical protein
LVHSISKQCDFFSILFNTVSSAASQIPMSRMLHGIKPRTVAPSILQSDSLSTRRDLILTLLDLTLHPCGETYVVSTSV